MGTERARLLLVVALAAGCAPQSADAPPAPRATDAPRPADAPEPGDRAADDAGRDAVKRLLATREAKPDASLDAPVLTRATSDVFEIAHEVRRLDVRDTRRVYDAKRGEMLEVPMDGTTNPAKVLQNKEWEEKAAAEAHRDLVLLTETYRHFRELFAERLELPELPADRLPLRFTVLWNRESFDRELLRTGMPVAEFVRAVWLPSSRTVLTYHGDDAFQSLDEWHCVGDRVQKQSDQVLAAAAVTELLRRYAALRRGTPADPDGFSPEYVEPRWLRIGLAELIGGVEVDAGRIATLDGGALFHDRVVLRLVGEGRRDRDLDSRWMIAQLISRHPRARRDPRSEDHVDADDYAFPLPDIRFTPRAWAFCHFLWNYDGGKYRDKLVTFVGRVLAGTGTSEVFATEIMGRPTVRDWGDVEMEFEWYWNQLVARKVGRDKTTKQWFETATDPPQGTVDAEFREVWAEAQGAPKGRPK